MQNLIAPINLISLETLKHQLTQFLPNFIAAALFLLGGLILGLAIEKIIKKILKRTKVFKKTGKKKERTRLTKMTALLPKYLIYFASFVLFFQILGFTPVSVLSIRIFNYLPNLIAGVAILVLGVFLAGLAARFITKHLIKTGFMEVLKSTEYFEAGEEIIEDSLMAIFYFIIIIVVLAQLKIATTVIHLLLILVGLTIGGVILLFSFFFFKINLQNFLIGLKLRNNNELEEAVDNNGTEFKLKRIGLFHTKLEGEDGEKMVSNQELIKEFLLR